MRIDVPVLGRRVRALREAAGLNQAQLAEAAGVSRQAVGALEAGRHLPRVDAALRLASALGLTVEELLAHTPAPAVSVFGDRLIDGRPVRAARVGGNMVCVPSPSSNDGESWHAPDAVIRAGRAHLLDGARLDGFVLLGCDPALGILADMGPSGAGRIVAVPANSRVARGALAAGRTHAALVHDVDPAAPTAADSVIRLRLATWRTGLAAPHGATGAIRSALAGRGTVVQRDHGAGAQAAYLRSLEVEGGAVPPGPLAQGHLDAGRRAIESGLAAVTIEPVAVALGLDFHPLETHRVELWIQADASGHPGATAIRELILSAPFRDRVRRFAGYELQAAA